MSIRTFQPGDESAQMSIYNQAASVLPGVKLATLDEIRRRTTADDFDPETRLYAIENDHPVAYATYQTNGRISYPWCLPGAEKWREPLLEAVLTRTRQRGLRQVFVAYQEDWQPIRDLFLEHDFVQSREMLNYVLELTDVPTSAMGTIQAITPFEKSDLPALLKMASEVSDASEGVIEESWIRNRYFSSDCLFVLRNRTTKEPEAFGVLVQNPDYADVRQLNARMPCFRLGAFGTEGMSVKRINGLFSFLVRDPKLVSPMGLDLLAYANSQLQDEELEALAAQVPSDVPHLASFYRQYFSLQGKFPVFTKAL